MKLSEKLAALEEEESKATSAQPSTSGTTAPAKRGRSAPKARPDSGWDATKKKVRELVLEEVAPKI